MFQKLHIRTTRATDAVASLNHIHSSVGHAQAGGSRTRESSVTCDTAYTQRTCQKTGPTSLPNWEPSQWAAEASEPHRERRTDRHPSRRSTKELLERT